jgi:hypothetical protein
LALIPAFGHLSPVGTGERVINLVDISCEADFGQMLAYRCEAGDIGIGPYV